jgi:hypothetical protein
VVFESKLGRQRFVFTFEANGEFDVQGFPVDEAEGEPYRRSGAYQIVDGKFVSPAINDGRPVAIRFENGRLIFTIDDELEFRLSPR